MIQRDYILRMIEEIGNFLAKLSGYKNENLHKKGLEEFLEFTETHFGLTSEDFQPDHLDAAKEKLKDSLEHYPDELGQLCLSGAEMAEDADQRAQAQTLYMLAWDALQHAEHSTGSFRFDRMVEMNSIRDKLGLMGINVS